MRNRIVSTALALLFALATGSALADQPRNLTWADLSVSLTAADNPFASLSSDQLVAVADIAALRARRDRGIKLTAEEASVEKSAVAKLKKDGIDVDGLLAKRDAVAERARTVAGAANPAIDGKLVRLPGYVLPLEFSGRKVTEFLLVPWVGACIHTPPPEPNQIVHVRPDKAFEMRRMFDAVWVTGTISASSSKRSVDIVDGSAEFGVAYSLRASEVAPYE